MTTWGRLSLGLVLLTLMANSAAAAEPKRVLIVHSFGRTTPPFAMQSTAFQTTLMRELHDRVDMDEVSLDMASYGQTALEAPFVELLLARLSQWQPDLVIPIGAPAGQFVVKYRYRLFPRASIIYTAMDRRTLPADALADNAILVGDSFDLPGLFDDILQLAPDTNHIAVVMGTSPLERFWTEALRAAAERFTNRVRFTWLNDLSFDETLRHAAALPAKSFILFGLLLRDASGVTHNQDRALQRLHGVANAPLYGAFRYQLGRGIVGGRLYDTEAAGAASARLAIRVLRGEPISALSSTLIQAPSPRYDGRELERWTIGEDRLPRGSVVEFRQRTVWQEYRWYAVSAVALGGAQTALIVMLLVQRRRRREAQEGLRQAEASAQRHLAQIAHLDRVAGMGQLASAIAHELNQPLAGILANAQAARRLLARPRPDLDEILASLDDIVSDDKRASEVIYRMRRLLRRTEVISVSLSLNDLAENTIRLVANNALLHGVAIEFVPALALPQVYGDLVQIQQVMMNLLTNAITAAAHGGASTRRVSVWTSVATAPYIEFGVHDSGKGIAETDVDRIFEPFFTTKPDGLGMGLTISRTIVEAHGGQLFAENDPAGGATFRVHLRTDHAVATHSAGLAERLAPAAPHNDCVKT